MQRVKHGDHERQASHHKPLYLDPEVYEALKRLMPILGAPMAFYLRKAVDKVLVEHQVKVGKPKGKRG